VSYETDDFVDSWGAPTQAVEVPPERYDEFAGVVPELLLTFWREFGFAGFGDGLFWICDPVAWQPSVDLWTRDLDLPMGPDRWHAVTRTAFGRMQLWGERTGMSLTIVPYRGWIRPSDQTARMASEAARNAQVYGAMLAQEKDVVDVPATDGGMLFDRTLAMHGPVGADTMYGLVPALALGGPATPDHVQVLDAEVHLQVLHELTPREVLTGPL
jgi:hypothetical protein